jgi:26S proteasome non-ATPase regulatory subunit 9
MKKIDEKIHLIHESEMASLLTEEYVTTTVEVSSVESELRPIAKFDEILEDSPAFFAGIEDGDLLLRFGSVDCNTPNPMASIPSVVKASLNKELSIVVLKNGSSSPSKLVLIPKVWSGRGMLGCHLTPLS